MRLPTLLVIPFAVTGLAATPVSAAQDAAEAEAAGENNPVNRVLCRRVAAPTGTRIGTRRICKTERQWQMIEDESRDTIEDIGNRSRVGNEG